MLGRHSMNPTRLRASHTQAQTKYFQVCCDATKGTPKHHVNTKWDRLRVIARQLLKHIRIRKKTYREKDNTAPATNNPNIQRGIRTCSMTSGAIQHGVPTKVLATFRRFPYPTSHPATPKSASFTRPSSPKRMLPALMSR